MTSSTEPARSRVRRVLPLAGKLLLAAVSAALALTAADAVVRIGDLNFNPISSRPNEDSILERREFRTRVVTNALGFREPRLPSSKPPGILRVVAVGDSFTQGYGVEEHDAYPRRLEAVLDRREPVRRHEVFNLGIPGACPLDYPAHVEDVGLAYEPDVVVVGLMANDVNDIYSKRAVGSRFISELLRRVQEEARDDRPAWKRMPESLWPSLYAYAGRGWASLRARSAAAGTEARRAPRARRPPIPDARWQDVLLGIAERYGRRAEVEAALREMPAEKLADLRPVVTGEYQYTEDPDPEPLFRLAALLRPRTNVDMVMLPPEYDAAWKETVGALRRIDALVRRAGARTVVLFAPAAFQVSPEAWRILRDLGFEMAPELLTDTTMIDRLRAFGAAEGIAVVDLLAPLRARRDEPLYFPLDGHWTQLGHEVAAEELAAAILAR